MTVGEFDPERFSSAAHRFGDDPAIGTMIEEFEDRGTVRSGQGIYRDIGQAVRLGALADQLYILRVRLDGNGFARGADNGGCHHSKVADIGANIEKDLAGMNNTVHDRRKFCLEIATHVNSPVDRFG